MSNLTNVLNEGIFADKYNGLNIYQKIVNRIDEILKERTNPEINYNKRREFEDDLKWLVLMKTYAQASSYLWIFKKILADREEKITHIERKFKIILEELNKIEVSNGRGYIRDYKKEILELKNELEEKVKLLRQPECYLSHHNLTDQKLISEYSSTSTYEHINKLDFKNALYVSQEVFDLIVKRWGFDGTATVFRYQDGQKAGYDPRTTPITFNKKPIIWQSSPLNPRFKVNYDVISFILRNVQYIPLVSEYAHCTNEGRKREIYLQLPDEVKEIINCNEARDFERLLENSREGGMINILGVYMLQWFRDLEENQKASEGALDNNQREVAIAEYDKKITYWHNCWNNINFLDMFTKWGIKPSSDEVKDLIL
jgi:hypothetical protein